MWIPVASLFTFVVYSMWRMFDASIAEACNETSRTSLRGLRLVMVVSGSSRCLLSAHPLLGLRCCWIP